MKDLVLSVVTPERSILKETRVDSIIFPGEMGQLNILPGHTNFITTLRYGTFAYKIKDEWQIAFLSGGFTQVYDGKVTVLAETLEMMQEIDVARAERDLQELVTKLKGSKLGTPEHSDLSAQRELALSRLKTAQNKIH